MALLIKLAEMASIARHSSYHVPNGLSLNLHTTAYYTLSLNSNTLFAFGGQ